jgi:DNA adenine methylase
MKIIVPPIKCQGIKTKLVPFIIKNINWDKRGKWIYINPL